MTRSGNTEKKINIILIEVKGSRQILGLIHGRSWICWFMSSLVKSKEIRQKIFLKILSDYQGQNKYVCIILKWKLCFHVGISFRLPEKKLNAQKTKSFAVLIKMSTVSHTGQRIINVAVEEKFNYTTSLAFKNFRFLFLHHMLPHLNCITYIVPALIDR